MFGDPARAATAHRELDLLADRTGGIACYPPRVEAAV
jgi:hypothetical protein